jgi:hypothetical protein
MLIPRASQTTVFYAVGVGVLVSIFIISARFHFLWFSFFGGTSVLAAAWILGHFLPAAGQITRGRLDLLDSK